MRFYLNNNVRWYNIRYFILAHFGLFWHATVFIHVFWYSSRGPYISIFVIPWGPIAIDIGSPILSVITLNYWSVLISKAIVELILSFFENNEIMKSNNTSRNVYSAAIHNTLYIYTLYTRIHLAENISKDRYYFWHSAVCHVRLMVGTTQ